MNKIIFFLLSLFGGGTGVYILSWHWANYFRWRDYLADALVAKLGYKDVLIEYLEESKFYDTAVPYMLSWKPANELRIDALLHPEIYGIPKMGWSTASRSPKATPPSSNKPPQKDAAQPATGNSTDSAPAANSATDPSASSDGPATPVVTPVSASDEINAKIVEIWDAPILEEITAAMSEETRQSLQGKNAQTLADYETKLQSKGLDLSQLRPLHLHMNEVFHGSTMSVNGLTFKIPSGMVNGSGLLVRGMDGTYLGFFVQIESDGRFVWDGKDLRTVVLISSKEAKWGTEVVVSSFDDENYVVKIPAGTKPGEFVRLPHLGVLTLGTKGVRSDLVVEVQVEPDAATRDDMVEVTMLTPEHIDMVDQAVQNRVVMGDGASTPGLFYASIHREFGVNSYKEIPDNKYLELMKFIYSESAESAPKLGTE